jgi:hypothetical protein
MTWMDGVEYWRAWARRTDGDIIVDAHRITQFYMEMVNRRVQFDDQMPAELVKELEMDK